MSSSPLCAGMLLTGFDSAQATTAAVSSGVQRSCLERRQFAGVPQPLALTILCPSCWSPSSLAILLKWKILIAKKQKVEEWGKGEEGVKQEREKERIQFKGLRIEKKHRIQTGT